MQAWYAPHSFGQGDERLPVIPRTALTPVGAPDAVSANASIGGFFEPAAGFELSSIAGVDPAVALASDSPGHESVPLANYDLIVWKNTDWVGVRVPGLCAYGDSPDVGC